MDLPHSNPSNDSTIAAYHNLLHVSPVAMSLYLSKSLMLESANTMMIDLWNSMNVNPKFASEVNDKPLFSLITECFSTGETKKISAYKTEIEINGKDAIAYFDHSFSSVLDDSDTIIGVLHMSLDVTNHFSANHEKELALNGRKDELDAEKNIQKELKSKVDERTKELASSAKQIQQANRQMTAALEQLEISNANLLRSNNELSQYAYIASHDLQEPLRKIRMYSGLLEEDEDISPKNKNSILKISSSAKRMTMLITDLLEYSKLIKSDIMMRPVDLNGIVSDVITDFELSISEKSADFIIADLPVINAVALQMNQLFYNLIGNALKFINLKVSPRIEIGFQKLTEEQVKKYVARPLSHFEYFDIFISDNGIGFDTRYADQIFEVFRRLHPKDIYPGSGIGLALCRSIVTNHEGILFVESEVGIGSTFHIILPLITIS